MRPHHTKDKGDLGVAHAIADLADQGFVVLTALCEHAPFDLVAYRDGTFVRVQVKYRALAPNGAIKGELRELVVGLERYLPPANRQARGRRRVHLLPRHRRLLLRRSEAIRSIGVLESHPESQRPGAQRAPRRAPSSGADLGLVAAQPVTPRASGCARRAGWVRWSPRRRRHPRSSW